MATVYLAHDLPHQRDVALKVLRPEISGALGSGRFSREIAIAARLHHPHILPIHDSGTLEVPGRPPLLYFAMPYVAGHSLRDRLDTEPQLPVEDAVRIAQQVADALDHAHRQGIVHRDIKPENILLDAGGEALVADFGIARALDAAGGPRLTETGLALGTPAYMSPEQGAGSTHLDGRADVYALGCVLYEMLAGEPPFTGPTAQAILARHAMDPVPTLRALRPAVGPGLRRVVLRALAKVPADRFATAQAFAEALASPEPIGTSESPADGALDRGRRRRRVFLAAAAASGALAALLVIATRTGRAKPVTADPAVVAVAPFRVTTGDSTLGYLHEGLVDLLSTKLGGTLAIRPIDSRTLLNAWREAGRGTSDLPVGRALAVAGRLGAGRLVDGELMRNGSRLTLAATLRQVPSGQQAARVSIEGAPDSLTSLIEQLSGRLLALAAGEPEERLSALTSTPPAALRAYLDGWTLLRRNSSDGALKRFEAALAMDSTFALAGLGASRALGELGLGYGGPDEQLAWRLRDRLSPSDRAYLDVVVGPRFPVYSSADFHAAADRFVQLDPTRADAWNAFGVAHCDVNRADRYTDPRCPAAYRRAVALDSTDATILWNVAYWAATVSDTTFARRTLGLYLRLDSLSPSSTMLRWLVATKLGDTIAAHRAALNDSMVGTRADWELGSSIWQMLNYYLSEGRGLSDAELVLQRTRAIAATGDQRASLENIPFQLALMRGRADGMPQSPSFRGGMSNFERIADALFADADPAPAVGAAAALERAVGSPVTGDCCLERFAVAEYALEAGRTAVARRALADMERYQGSPEAREPGSGEFRVWPLIVRAQLAAIHRSPAAADQLRQLDSVLVNPGLDWQLAPRYGDLISARLHEARREYPAALAALRRRDGAFFAPIAVTYHREEGRIAAEAGDTAGAIRAYQRYLRIRADAQPRLMPQVQQVRTALAALERAFSGRQ